MDIAEAKELARCWTGRISSRYGLLSQFDPEILKDMYQQALLRYIEAKHSGQNERQSIWRGLHEVLREQVYGGSSRRSFKISYGKLPPFLASRGNVEDTVDFWRTAERMDPGSVAYEYYVRDKTLAEVGAARGVSESRMSQLLKEWRLALQ